MIEICAVPMLGKLQVTVRCTHPAPYPKWHSLYYGLYELDDGGLSEIMHNLVRAAEHAQWCVEDGALEGPHCGMLT